MKKIMLALGAVLALLAGCKKNVQDQPGNAADSLAVASPSNLLKDSLFLYTKEIYLWNSVLPDSSSFNPRQYSGATDLDAATAEMNALRAYQPLDRFSFVTTQEASDGLQTGASVDYGFFIKAAAADLVEPVDSVRWYVTYAFDNSPAGQAGVDRGWYISSINNTSIGYDQSSVDLLNDVFFGTTNTAAFTFVKPDGTTTTLNLTKADFVSNSVLYKNVYQVGGSKIGYFVFKQFFGTPSVTELTNVFSYFKTEGINELVVDLRYNPGGSTDTQDELANMIAPASANNQVMYKYIFNTNLQNGNFPLLKQKAAYSNDAFTEANNTLSFTKAGGLNLNRVFFIVSNNTASASELLINNLKPYMDVKLIGDTTYGKPVGFFPVNIYDYAIYPISFKTVNSAGNADYFSGFAPDKEAPDGVNKAWGDATEPCLASALSYITTGAFRGGTVPEASYRKQWQKQEELEPLTKSLERGHFIGMFKKK